jgi:hypothetical protein
MRDVPYGGPAVPPIPPSITGGDCGDAPDAGGEPPSRREVSDWNRVTPGTWIAAILGAGGVFLYQLDKLGAINLPF